MRWSKRWERCRYPYCTQPNSPHTARGYCAACYFMLYRDENPPGARDLQRARRRARKSWRARRRAILEAERRLRERALREHAWKLARML